jgi:ubiquinone/menaquinone biosynthesis C-methylase UbiE
MSEPTNPRREHPSTYVVQDRSNEKELLRLRAQDQMMTTGMGGILPEQPDPTIFHQILDVGCGTGNWLIEAAKTYPTMSRLEGGDVSSRMLEYARQQAAEAQVADRVKFHVMDALRRLEFPDWTFDLVNERFAASYLRTWDWPKYLQEFMRVCKPGGVVRLTEGDVISESTSPGLISIHQLLFQSLNRAGHYFTPNKNGLTSELAHLFTLHGFQNVQTRACTLKIVVGTPQWQSFYEDMKNGFQTLAPFFKKWTNVPDDYNALCQQALSEIQQPDFVAHWNLLTVWGNTPE